jgi:starvation-inducible outer membrane lipoprotein
MRIIGLFVLMTLLAACQTQDSRPDPELAAQPSPQQVSLGRQVPPEGALLTWAGKVQAVENLPRVTRIEVLSYPANSKRQPITEQRATGRFIVEMGGFLEPRDLMPGTSVTIQGRYVSIQEGKVGKAPYRYPLILGEKLDVWRSWVAEKRSADPDVRWSIGIGTSGSNTGVGVGIGF